MLLPENLELHMWPTSYFYWTVLVLNITINPEISLVALPSQSLRHSQASTILMFFVFCFLTTTG